MNGSSLVLNIKGLSQYLNVSYAQASQIMHSKALATFCPSKRLLTTKPAVDKWLADPEAQAQASNVIDIRKVING